MSAQTARQTEHPVGMGVIGLGKWSYQLGRAVQRSTEAKLLSCYTRTPEKREKYATTFHCEAAATLQEFLETPGLEAVILSTPAHAHDELAVACARQGLHLFVEKPMALSVAGAMWLIDLCRHANVTLMIGHEMRRLGSIRAMRKLLEKDMLGDVVTATASMTLKGRFEPDNWRCHRDTNRGGALMQLGIHPIENLNYLLGRPLLVRGAFSNTIAPNNVDDVGSAIITYDGSIQATVTASYVSPSSQRLSLFGTDANLHQAVDMRVWPDATQVDQNTELWLEDARERRAVSITPRDALCEQIEEFAASVRGEKSPETGGDEGLWAVAVVEAALRSATSGQAVDVGQMIEEINAKRNLP